MTDLSVNQSNEIILLRVSEWHLSPIVQVQKSILWMVYCFCVVYEDLRIMRIVFVVIKTHNKCFFT